MQDDTEPEVKERPPKLGRRLRRKLCRNVIRVSGEKHDCFEERGHTGRHLCWCSYRWGRKE